MDMMIVRRGTPPPPPPTIYGVEWNQGASSPALTRLDDAEGLTVGTPTAGSAIASDFDSVYPWSDIKRCNLADNGTVNHYYGEALYEDAGSNGQVMVEIPKFYYKSEKDGSIFRWWISETQVDGFKIHPAFISDGVEKDRIYFSAYEGCSLFQLYSWLLVEQEHLMLQAR